MASTCRRGKKKLDSEAAAPPKAETAAEPATVKPKQKEAVAEPVPEANTAVSPASETRPLIIEAAAQPPAETQTQAKPPVPAPKPEAKKPVVPAPPELPSTEKLLTPEQEHIPSPVQAVQPETLPLPQTALPEMPRVQTLIEAEATPVTSAPAAERPAAEAIILPELPTTDTTRLAPDEFTTHLPELAAPLPLAATAEATPPTASIELELPTAMPPLALEPLPRILNPADFAPTIEAEEHAETAPIADYAEQLPAEPVAELAPLLEIQLAPPPSFTEFAQPETAGRTPERPPVAVFAEQLLQPKAAAAEQTELETVETPSVPPIAEALAEQLQTLAPAEQTKAEPLVLAVAEAVAAVREAIQTADPAVIAEATEQLQQQCLQLFEQLGITCAGDELKLFVDYVAGLELLAPAPEAEDISIYDEGTHERKQDSFPSRLLAYLSQYVPSHAALGSFALRSATASQQAAVA